MAATKAKPRATISATESAKANAANERLQKDLTPTTGKNVNSRAARTEGRGDNPAEGVSDIERGTRIGLPG